MVNNIFFFYFGNYNLNKGTPIKIQLFEQDQLYYYSICTKEIQNIYNNASVIVSI